MTSFGYLLLVTASQLALYVALPVWAIARITWRDRGERLFAAATAGVSSAALWGRLCNGSGIRVDVALGAWLAAWIVVGLLLRRRRPHHTLQRPGWTLGAIILLAAATRLIHPLQTWALGQSDAYSHLGFLANVLAQGKLSNDAYPPAHAWVMAFPAWVLHIQPYWTARFGGAFFGVGLTLGVYALITQMKNRAAGLAAAALVAGCPLFYLLQKTGVGSFANQLGLLLVIAALWAFTGRRHVLLALTGAALAVSVPMMLLHLLLLLTLWIFAERRSARGYLGLLGLLLLIGVGLLLITTRMPAERGIVIASMLTGQYSVAKEVNAGWIEVFRVLGTDFFSVKRIGYGSWALNGAALVTTGIFVAALISGIRKKDVAWRRVGLWGLLTSINLHLGWLQFTDYQREGWSFLLALACLGGLLFHAVWQWRSTRQWQTAWTTAIAIASLAGLAFPPAHTILAGPAESEVVKYLLRLDPNITVLARNTSSFPGGQGDVAKTLHRYTLHSADRLRAVRGSIHFLRADLSTTPNLPLAMQFIQPRQIQQMRLFLRHAKEEQQALEDAVSNRVLSVERVSPHLDVWILKGPE